MVDGLLGELCPELPTAGDEELLLNEASSSVVFAAAEVFDLCGILKLLALKLEPSPKAKLARLVELLAAAKGGVLGFVCELSRGAEVCLKPMEAPDEACLAGLRAPFSYLGS